MRVLVTGGAGYIGSHLVRLLAESKDFRPIVLDRSSEAMNRVLNVVLPHGSVGTARLDLRTLDSLETWEGYLPNVDAVVHCAASIEVGHSMIDPASFYENNVTVSLRLMDACVRAKLPLVFCSSAAVYGTSMFATPQNTCLVPRFAGSPYGETKLIVERALDAFAKAYGFRSVSLRFFNVAGAHSDGTLGELHDPETHLIPCAFRAIDEGRPLHVHGNNYPTLDGTAIRDYVHVMDVAKAIVASLQYLSNPENPSLVGLNVGRGVNVSVLQILDAIREVTRKQVEIEMTPKREGDVAHLVANIDRTRKLLGWTPEVVHLEEIVRTAWNFHRASRGASKS